MEKYGAYGLLSPFYVSCTLNFVWLGIFLLSVGVNLYYVIYINILYAAYINHQKAHDTPSSHPTILQEERDYIERSIGDKVRMIISEQLILALDK